MPDVDLGPRLLTSFYVRGVPRTQGSKKGIIPRVEQDKIRAGRPGRALVLDDNRPELRAWRADVKSAAVKAYKKGPVAGPVGVELTFAFVRPKAHTRAQQAVPWKDTLPDWEKLARAVCDSLTKVVWVDDGQVSLAVVRKVYATDQRPPGVAVKVVKLEEESYDAAST